MDRSKNSSKKFLDLFWIGLFWIGLFWIGLHWIGLFRIGLHWIGLKNHQENFLDEFLDLSTNWFDFWSWLLRIACWPDSLLFSFQLLVVNFCLALVPCKGFHFLSTILLPK